MNSLRCRWGDAFMLALLSAAFSVSPRTVHAKPSADIVLSVPIDTVVEAGQQFLLPVRISGVTVLDSVTSFNFGVRVPLDIMLVDTAAVKGPALPSGAGFSSAKRDSVIVVGGYWTLPLANNGTLFFLRCTPKGDVPDNTSREVRLERLSQNGTLLYYLNERNKPPCTAQNGSVRVRNLNMVPVRIAVLADSSVDAGSPCSIQVQGGGLLSFSGTTALQFALTVPPALYQSVSVQGGLLPADAVTLADAGSGLFRVSGSVPNPVGGTGTLFTMQGLTKQDIPDSTVFTISIERLSDGGNPLPYARKGDQTPDCAVSNGAVTVRSPVSVAHGGAAIPARSEVTAYPNPFNAVITFRVHGPLSDGPIDATIFTVLGTVVRRWSQSTPEWTWDGRDASGVSVASGVYVVVVRNGEKTWQKRVTLLR